MGWDFLPSYRDSPGELICGRPPIIHLFWPKSTALSQPPHKPTWSKPPLPPWVLVPKSASYAWSSGPRFALTLTGAPFLSSLGRTPWTA